MKIMAELNTGVQNQINDFDVLRRYKLLSVEK